MKVNGNMLTSEFMGELFRDFRVTRYEVMKICNNIETSDIEVDVVIGGKNQSGDTTNVITVRLGYHLNVVSFKFSRNTSRAALTLSEIMAISEEIRANNGLQ